MDCRLLMRVIISFHGPQRLHVKIATPRLCNTHSNNWQERVANDLPIGLRKCISNIQQILEACNSHYACEKRSRYCGTSSLLAMPRIQNQT